MSTWDMHYPMMTKEDNMEEIKNLLEDLVYQTTRLCAIMEDVKLAIEDKKEMPANVPEYNSFNTDALQSILNYGYDVAKFGEDATWRKAQRGE